MYAAHTYAAHTYAHPPTHGFSHAAARRLAAAAPHAHPCTHETPHPTPSGLAGPRDLGGLWLCPSYPVAAGDGRGAVAETGREKGLSNRITPAASNAEGRYPPFPSLAPATSAVGSPCSLGTRRHAEGRPSTPSLPAVPTQGEPRKQDPAPQDFTPRGSSAPRKAQGCRAEGFPYRCCWCWECCASSTRTGCVSGR